MTVSNANNNLASLVSRIEQLEAQQEIWKKNTIWLKRCFDQLKQDFDKLAELSDVKSTQEKVLQLSAQLEELQQSFEREPDVVDNFDSVGKSEPVVEEENLGRSSLRRKQSQLTQKKLGVSLYVQGISGEIFWYRYENGERNFVGINLTGADLTKKSPNGVNLSRANLIQVKLNGTDWSNEKLRGANLTQADLNNTNFCNANLQEAILDDAFLYQAQLESADLYKASLKGANLTEASLTGANLSGANLSGAYLSGAYLIKANLCGAYLENTDLSNTYLSSADLRGADLSNANLENACLENAKLAGAILDGAKLTGAMMPDRTIHE